jgi:predicted O-methyltransferase YrrM
MRKPKLAEEVKRFFQPPPPKNRVDEISGKIEKLARAYGLPIMTNCTRKILVNVIHETKPRRVLEIGTLLGYSTILIGNELERDAEIVTVEIVREIVQIAQENIIRAEISPTVRTMVGDAREIIPRLEGEFDLVFIDGEKKEYLDYLRAVESKLHAQSVVVADNAGLLSDGMQDYLNYVRSSGKYESKYVASEEDGIVRLEYEDGIHEGIDGVEVSTKL